MNIVSRIIPLIACLFIVMSTVSSSIDVGSDDASDSESASEDPSRTFGRALLGIVLTGEARFDNLDISIGVSMTTLVCQCMRDDSCEDWVEVFCDPIGTLWPEADRAFFAPVSEGVLDPTVGVCYVIDSLRGGEVPPGTGWYETPLFPSEPVLSIEAVRWPQASTYRYAIRYQFVGDESFDEDDYDRIDFTVRGSSTSDVIELAGLAPIGSASDLPLAASFSNDELFTTACIRFREAPQGLPREYCTRIVEVSP